MLYKPALTANGTTTRDTRLDPHPRSHPTPSSLAPPFSPVLCFLWSSIQVDCVVPLWEKNQLPARPMLCTLDRKRVQGRGTVATDVDDATQQTWRIPRHDIQRPPHTHMETKQGLALAGIPQSSTGSKQRHERATPFHSYRIVPFDFTSPSKRRHGIVLFHVTSPTFCYRTPSPGSQWRCEVEGPSCSSETHTAPPSLRLAVVSCVGLRRKTKQRKAETAHHQIPPHDQNKHSFKPGQESFHPRFLPLPTTAQPSTDTPPPQTECFQRNDQNYVFVHHVGGSQKTKYYEKSTAHHINQNTP